LTEQDQNNKQYIAIPPNDPLRDLGVTKFVRHSDLVQIVLSRNRVINFNIHPKQFQLTMGRFRESAINGTAGLSKEIVSKMERILVHPDNGYIQYLQLNNNNNGKQESESDTENLNLIYATVYTDETSLYEAIIINSASSFAKISLGTRKILLCTEIQLSDSEALVPLPFNLYMSRPYVFRSEKEFYSVVEKVRHETLDTLYQKVKTKWDLYIDNDKEHNIMCAGDTIFTYFQDKLGMTHYDFFVGGNGTGKTNNLHILNLLAYRNVLSSDMTAANMYQLLGNGKHGIVTMCEDEADDIDEDREKMKIYKDGVTTSIPVLRTDISFGRKQFKYNTFCFKACAAERLPDVIKAKGFLQRCIIYNCRYGSPRYDISEVIEPGGDRKLQCLLDDLLELRNKLLVYRLLHYHEEIPNMELNIKDREKQLFKSTFRVFQNSDKALEELKIGINKYLSEYRQRRSNTFHAFLYKVVRELIKIEKTFELKSTLIWTRLKDELHGREIPNKPMSFECEDFGTVTQGSVTKTLREVFGANLKRYGKAGRCLKFYSKNLNKLAKVYEAPTEIKVTSIDGSVNKNRRKHIQSKHKKSYSKSKNKQVSLVSLVTPSRGIKSKSSKSKSGNSRENQIQNLSNSTKNNIKNNPLYTQRASLPSLPSPSKNGQKIGNTKVVLTK
jgi:hypothetical protein